MALGSKVCKWQAACSASRLWRGSAQPLYLFTAVAMRQRLVSLLSVLVLCVSRTECKFLLGRLELLSLLVAGGFLWIYSWSVEAVTVGALCALKTQLFSVIFAGHLQNPKGHVELCAFW